MQIQLGIVMDPISAITIKKDSSFAMLLAAQAKGWPLFYMEQSDLFLAQGIASATVKPLQVFEDAQNWYALGEARTIALSELDVILMRKDPP
ncbi:MAG: glutathione synthase, partial [Piscirickettsiaceae bacterium]|nr:glutathione synthase [Piscirickettsiaceae bacterium]